MAGVAVLVYDGDCGLCTRCAVWAGQRSRGMRVVPWQQADLTGLGLTVGECRTAVQFVRDGEVYSGGAAVAEVLRGCGQPYAGVGAALGARVVEPFVARAYVLIARHRHRLPGSTPACASHGDEGRGGGARWQDASPTGAPAGR